MQQASLYIGRFQPFHKGHLFMIQQCPTDQLYIGIGSSQYDHTMDNPFSFDERKHMIQETLKACFDKQYQIYAIPDIHDPPNWVDHINRITPHYQIVLTNNMFTAALFKEKGFDVLTPGYYHRPDCKGKVIRERMRNDQPWEQFVPKETVDFLKKIDATGRLKQIANTND